MKNGDEKRPGFIVYRDWRDVFCEFDDKLFRELIEAIFDLGLDKEERECSPLVKVAMKLIKPTIMRDWENYERRCTQNRENGANGGRKKTQSVLENPVGFSETQSVSKNPVGSEITQSVPENPVGFKKPSGPNKIIDNRNMIIDNREKKDDKRDKEDIDSKESLSVSTDSEDRVLYQEYVDFYNSAVKGKLMARCIKLTSARKTAIRARVKEYGKDMVLEAIRLASVSAFLNGHNDRNWKADFDFVFKANSMARILEGKYNNTENGTNWSTTQRRAVEAGMQAASDIFASIKETAEGTGY